jgi:hypothetical protein
MRQYLKLKVRDKIDNRIAEHLFTDYWDIFVLKHQHPANISLHIIGILFFYVLLFTIWMSRNPWFLCWVPLTQLVGLMGHLLFERSHVDLQDAIFSWRASYCLGKMLLRVVQGKYGADIRQRREALQNFLVKERLTEKD